jgi:hypothetical protein
MLWQYRPEMTFRPPDSKHSPLLQKLISKALTLHTWFISSRNSITATLQSSAFTRFTVTIVFAVIAFAPTSLAFSFISGIASSRVKNWYLPGLLTDDGDSLKRLFHIALTAK